MKKLKRLKKTKSSRGKTKKERESIKKKEIEVKVKEKIEKDCAKMRAKVVVNKSNNIIALG